MIRLLTATLALAIPIMGLAQEPMAIFAPPNFQASSSSEEIAAQRSRKRESLKDRDPEIHKEMVSEIPLAPKPDAAVVFRDHRINVGDAELYVQEQGDGTPILLIPGGPGNTLQSFHPHFSQAAEFSRVIYYDPRGVGQSDWVPRDGYSVELAIEDLERLRESLDIEQWVVLGHSFGGLLAQLYTIFHPDRALGLVLVSTSTSMPIEETDSRKYMTEEERVRVQEIYSDGVNSIIPIHTDQVDLATVRKLVYNAFLNGEWTRQHFYKPSEEKIAQIALYEWVHDKNYTRLVNSSGFAYDLDGAFLDTPIPVLIYEGKWDPEWVAQKPILLQAQFPNSKVLVFDNSAHFSFSEEPDRFFSELKEFVDELKPIAPTRISNWRKKLEALVAPNQ